MNQRGTAALGIFLIVSLFTVFGIFMGKASQKRLDSKSTATTQVTQVK